jgi:hypothetical protein
MTNRRGLAGGLAYVDNYQKDPPAGYVDISEDDTTIEINAATAYKLSNAGVAGQYICFVVATDSVAPTVTADNKINVAAQTIMTFSAVDEYIILRSCAADTTNGGYQWRVVVNDGAVLS